MHRSGNRITDDDGRTLILRGVNLGGSSKIPLKSPSFVGRPFLLEEAAEHFERLKNRGFTFIRFIITWEALEPSGPGMYDESYIGYLKKILHLAGKMGISVYMDPHQDVWSRWTGGDGAPAWTLEKLGIDVDRLAAAGAAINWQKQGKNKTGMIWPVNYSLYATATMFTLFFGAKTFAPELKIEGENVQDFLQHKYLAAFRFCFQQLKDCKAIVGWGTMNEPHPGFIAYQDIRQLENVTLALGPVPSPFQAMCAAEGQPVKVPVYTPWLKGWKVTGRKIINPQGLSIFREGFCCPWKQAGVWTGEGEKAKLLRPDHFSTYQGRPIRFTDDFLKPFMFRFINSMNEVKKPLLFFIEGVPHAEHPTWSREEPQNTINAFHHYDGFTLFTKSYRPWFAVDPSTGRIILGKKKAAALFSEKLALAKVWAREHMDDMPCFLGEFGLPFDMNKRKAYKTGDYSLHEEAISRYYDAIDEHLLGSTIWNYTADNTHKNGDHWNGEDLSIVTSFSADGMLFERAIGGWLRPYPMATAGLPLKFIWEAKRTAFRFRFYADPKIKAPTEIFIPSLWFKYIDVSVSTSKGDASVEAKIIRTEYSRDEQRLFVYNDGCEGEVELYVSEKN